MEKLVKELVKEDVESDQLLEQAISILNQKELILFNDDFNSIQFIVLALVKVVGHSTEQAEQCATIAHYKDSCSIKKGSFEELKPISRALSLIKITTEIH